MGTNYYWQTLPCPTCQQVQDKWHIGKSSAGWCFSVHIMPDKGIQTLGDWQKQWESGGQIVNEYGEIVAINDILTTITKRRWDRSWEDQAWFGYRNEAEFHARNESERGPNGLLRHKIGRFCVGHGVGPWDYMQGEFS